MASPPPDSPRRLSPEARRRQIIAAARTVFAQRPHDRVSTADVAVAAGVTRALVHHYFRGIDDLRQAMAEQILQNASGLLAPGDDDSLADRARANIGRFLDAVDANRDAWFAVLGPESEVHVTPAGRALRQAVLEQMLANNAAIITDTEWARLCLTGYIAFSDAICRRWLDGEAGRDQAERVLSETRAPARPHDRRRSTRGRAGRALPPSPCPTQRSRSERLSRSMAAKRSTPSKPESKISRRTLLQGAGALAVSGAAVGPNTATSAAAAPFRRRGQLKRRPNFLVILADEYRYPPVYESVATRAYRSNRYVAERSLRDEGVEFENHYIMSSACAPSRTSFFTGQYPSLHGVSQTGGVAKNAIEQDMFWLDPNTLPTMGDYFRAGGYDTYYKGKWHLSHADLTVPGTYDQVLSFTEHGRRDPAGERTYLAANRLDGYGFDGWIGPEPHGGNPLNSGSSARKGGGRDAQFAAQTADLLHRLATRADDRPWLVVSSFVNPHDIALWGALTLLMPQWNLLGQLKGSAVPRDLFDTAQYRATSTEDLEHKPSCQRSYLETYPRMLQRTPNTDAYRRFYYQLQETVNHEIQKVLDALSGHSSMAADTIVIFTSDHGDMLGAHGGMHQKWHQAYEESTHVPLLIHNPTLFPGRRTVDALTSHADVLPTMLGLADLDPERLRAELAHTHSETHPLIGRDLSAALLGDDPPTGEASVYFMTDDEISRGSEQVSFRNEMYPAVTQPNHLETVIATLRTGADHTIEKWKYTRYFDTLQFWSNPPGEPPPIHLPPEAPPEGEDIVTLIAGNVDQAGEKEATTTVKHEPAADQIEVYNVTRDPLELDNLIHSRDVRTRATIGHLARLLQHQRRHKRRIPSSGNVPGQEP